MMADLFSRTIAIFSPSLDRTVHSDYDKGEIYKAT